MAAYSDSRFCAVAEWAALVVMICACFRLFTLQTEEPKYDCLMFPLTDEEIAMHEEGDPSLVLRLRYFDCLKRDVAARLSYAWRMNKLAYFDGIVISLTPSRQLMCNITIDDQGNTPLHVAVKIDSCRSASELMASCPRDLFTPNTNGQLPRDMGNAACIKYEITLRMNQQRYVDDPVA